MRELAIGLIVLGGVLLATGVVLWLAQRAGLPLGRLPGDLQLRGRGWSFSFPIVTSIMLSIVLTVLLNLFLRR